MTPPSIPNARAAELLAQQAVNWPMSPLEALRLTAEGILAAMRAEKSFRIRVSEKACCFHLWTFDSGDVLELDKDEWGPRVAGAEFNKPYGEHGSDFYELKP